jgi:Tfp pilus assembly protein FimT
MKKQYADYGITLTEVLIAVFILSVVSAIGIGFTANEWRRERAMAVSNEMLGWLEGARRSSIRGSSCTISINTNSPLTEGMTMAQLAQATGNCSNSSLSALTLTQITSGYSITLTAFDGTSTTNSFTFTSRGSVYSPLSQDKAIFINLNPGGYMRCIAIKGLVADMTIGRSSSSSPTSASQCDTTTSR